MRHRFAQGGKQMTEKLLRTLSLLRGYLSRFHEKGYDSSCADEIISLCTEGDDTPFSRLSEVFGLERFEKGAVLLCLLVSVSGGCAKAASQLCASDGAYITPALISAMFFGREDILPFTELLTPGSSLDRLLEGAAPVFNAPLRIKNEILTFLTCGSISDPSFMQESKREAAVPLKGQQRAGRELVCFVRERDIAEPFILQLTGAEGSGRRTCAERALAQAGRGYVHLRLSESMTENDIISLSVKLLLSGRIPVVSLCESSERACRLLERLADETGFVISVTGTALTGLSAGLPTVITALPMPDIREQYELWVNACSSLELSEDTDLAELTGEFDMTPGAIEKALRYAVALSGGGRLCSADIKNGCSRSFVTDMGGKAVRLDCAFSWKDIVLPERSAELLHAACQQVRLRHAVLNGWGFSEKMPYGRGVSMIFTGPPGTGKTMAAQVIAGELGMDIYRISLANVVSKYIGETEKNLNDIFDKARLRRCILFFDEADVLFSRRTEVKEANDKYSNMEAAFLLQKMEEYSGVVILATNLVQNFDEAFKRRMRFIIDFPFPDAQRRREMWLRAFPEKAPLVDIDLDFLVSQFELSGSNIRSIALHSAFLAASENSGGIGMKHIMAAIRNEYAKSGKAFTKAEAGEYYFDT